MTEPVRNALPTLLDLRAATRRLCAASVAVALAILTPVASHAAPASSPGETAIPAATTTTPAPSDAEPEPPPESDVHAALDAGDLSTARELALARSEADPSADNFVLEAQVWLALGDYDNAALAYAKALDALPEDASNERETITEALASIEASARGTKADEPESTHRERLDSERAERLAALNPKPPPPPEVVDTPKREPIIKKWYFWVTLGAIVASAGAIVGIATTSAIDDGNQDADQNAAARRPIPVGGVMFRF